MFTEKPGQRVLPDVAKEKHQETSATLNWVGMSGIEMPVLLKVDPAGPAFRQSAQVDAFVSLDRQSSRGIHMSRLYMTVQQKLGGAEFLSSASLKETVAEFLQSHSDLSGSARVQVNLQWPLKRKALKSDNEAWRSYPVRFSYENREGEEGFYLEVQILYSSTCPASAALSRQLIQQKFSEDFSIDQKISAEEIREWLGKSENLRATPHAQRSVARVKVRLSRNSDWNPSPLINLIEDTLQTAVQGAVKREDEQEFALRNGQNLMFCEDAARRLKRAFDQEAAILDYVAELNHIESLHPHSAMSRITKGIPAGLKGFEADF